MFCASTESTHCCPRTRSWHSPQARTSLAKEEASGAKPSSTMSEKIANASSSLPALPAARISAS